ncbi:MAG: family 10 glycosylhydrolase [Anaerolineae bacterium]|nr:family 10 glycosylhydrolase [Anaerolineae bacterium]
MGLTLRNLFLGLLLLAPVSIASDGSVDAQQIRTATFETLAGQAGRAEAWYQLALPKGQTQADAPAARLTSASDLVNRFGATGTRAGPVVAISEGLTRTVFLPLVQYSEPLMVERRAIWITRYDWTTLMGAPVPEDVDRMVAQIAGAGFNTIFFQVRAAGDAYYTPGVEPWADRLTAGAPGDTLGRDPGWDPLARIIAQGHAAGLEVHAYVNVYTAWLSPPSDAYGALWPPATVPPQMFDRFTYGPGYVAHPGVYGLGYGWRQYDESGQWMPLSWGSYLWASPGLDQVQAHVKAVIMDIVGRYPVDGVHLDLVRYAGPAYSYDPASNTAAGPVKTLDRDQWQRDRITALVRDVREGVQGLRADGLLVSAAVWPYTTDKWGWDVSEGYSDFYQDARGWLATGAVDALVPMLYGGKADEMWRWEMLMADFLAEADGRAVYPGIGSHYEDFAAIAARIDAARAAGAPGHAIFSYSGLANHDAWEALASGPYSSPAALP